MQIPRGTLTLLGFNATGDLGPLTAYTSRRAGTVWFPKAPPLKPPSIPQIRMRDRMRLAAQAWKALSNEARQRWHDACRRAHLYIHGYNLWVWYQITRSRSGLSTIERQSGLSLLQYV
jgi:hypothetical protein